MNIIEKPKKLNRTNKNKNQNQKIVRRKKFNFTDVLIDLFPWSGDKGVEKLRKTMFLVSIMVFSVCLFLVVEYFAENKKSENLYNDLEKLYQKADPADERNNVPPEDPEEPWRQLLIPLEGAQALLEHNPDTVGYISIEGTKVSYPLLYRTVDDNFYLSHNFYGEPAKLGAIFLDYRCDFDVLGKDNLRARSNTNNLVIYGHNAKDMSMFGQLKQYDKDNSFYGKHPIISLNSNYRTYKYKIFAVCFMNDVPSQGDVYDYQNKLSFNNKEEFYSFANEMKKRSIITNEVDLQYGDQFVTLSTCSSIFSDAKLIVVGRLVRDGEDPLSGTQNYSRNENVRMPDIWYKNHSGSFDESKFVPYPER
jgi:sortase B